jgi:hypothetical protein
LTAKPILAVPYFRTFRPFVTICHLTYLRGNEQTIRVLGNLRRRCLKWFGVVSKRSYFWHQAQVCMSLARKQRYQDLALELAQNAGGERDFDILLPSSCLSSSSNPTAATRANSYP